MELNPIQKQEQRDLREAYSQFWTNNTAFKRGWARPLVNYEDVRELLDEAATYVLLLRNKLDAQSGKHPIRSPKTGSATEYLWTVEYNPINEKERFVRDLVLATFSDANGYLEGLTEEAIVKHIKECQDKKKNVHENLKNKLQENFAIFEGKVKEVLSPNHVILPEEANHIQKVIHGLVSLSNHLDVHIEKKKQSAPKPEESKQEEKARKENERKEQEALLQTIAELNKERHRKEAEAIQKEMTEAKQEQERILKEKESQGVLKIQQIAHDVEHLKSDIEHLTLDTKSLDVAALRSNPAEGMKTIEQLEKKCLNYTEGLLQDLASLDEVVGSEDTRPLRKQQVHTVQELMREIDQVNEKLHVLLYQLKQDQKSKEEEHFIQQAKGPEAAPKEEVSGEPKKVKTVIGMTPDGRAIVVEMTPEEQKQLEKLIEEEMAQIQKQQQEQRESEEPASEKDEMKEPKRKKLNQPEEISSPSQVEDMETTKRWQDLKLPLKFESEDHPLFYVLAAYVPGLKQDDLSIQLSKSTRMLTVRGSRIPTAEEIETMKKQVKHMHKLDPKGIYFPAEEDEDTSVMRLGAGRFGTFQQSFQLPPGVVIEKMVATYNGGVLQILVPKEKAETASQPQKPQKKMPYDVYSAPMPIYNDNQMWWQ